MQSEIFMAGFYQKLFILAAAVLFLTFSAAAQNGMKLNLEMIGNKLDQSECVTIAAGKIKICRYDYKFENKSVEAVIVRPAADGRYPGVLLAPGFDLTARDLIPMGVQFAHENFASVAVTPPGFGKSEGAADFVGPKTIETFASAWEKFKRESFVNGEKMALYGHSRGGMAASLLAVRLKDAQAAVLASGIYDFKLASEEIRLAGIRERMITETAMNEEAFKERSAILRAEEITAPILILHGETDDKTPVSQAHKLRDRLAALKKDFEIKIYPNTGHALDMREVSTVTIDFLRRRLNISAK